jgi:hypothetical protein
MSMSITMALEKKQGDLGKQRVSRGDRAILTRWGYSARRGIPVYYKHWAFYIAWLAGTTDCLRVILRQPSTSVFDMGRERHAYYDAYRMYMAEDGDLQLLLDLWCQHGTGLGEVHTPDRADARSATLVIGLSWLHNGLYRIWKMRRRNYWASLKNAKPTVFVAPAFICPVATPLILIHTSGMCSIGIPSASLTSREWSMLSIRQASNCLPT